MPCSAAMAEFEVDVMGHVMSEVPETGEKRPPECAAEQLSKRIRPGGWTEETPPPSPHESSSEASEDESEEEEDDEEDAERGYQGSILASCLLSDKRAGFAGESESTCELSRAASPAAGYGWYADSGYQRPQNQTVECDGKSYIQLGAMPPRRERSQFYRYQRFTALHATMVKLSRHRRMMDPLLRKSVLLFNTMRHIERELEQEGLSLAAAFNPHHFDSGPLTLDPPPAPPPPPPPPPQPLPPPQQQQQVPPAALSLPPPPPSDEINWGSVLSLGSQPDMELLPCEPVPLPPCWSLPPLSADDVLRSVPERRDDVLPPPADTVSLLAL